MVPARAWFTRICHRTAIGHDFIGYRPAKLKHASDTLSINQLFWDLAFGALGCKLVVKFRLLAILMAGIGRNGHLQPQKSQLGQRTKAYPVKASPPAQAGALPAIPGSPGDTGQTAR